MKNTYPGISYQTTNKKYSCRYTFNGIRYHLGFYDSEEEAYCVREAFEYSILLGETVADDLKQYKKKLNKQELINGILIELKVLHSNLSDNCIKLEVERIIKLCNQYQ